MGWQDDPIIEGPTSITDIPGGPQIQFFGGRQSWQDDPIVEEPSGLDNSVSGLASMMTQPFAMARDALAAGADGMQQYAQTPEGKADIEKGTAKERGFVSEAAAGVGRGGLGLVDAAVGVSRVADNWLPPYIAMKWALNKVGAAAGVDDVDTVKAGISDSIQDAKKSEMLRPSTDVDKVNEGSWGDKLTSPKWLVASVSEQVPQIAAQIGAAILTGGGSVGAQAGAFGLAGGAQAAGQYKNDAYRRVLESGGTKDEAVVSSDIGAAIVGVGATALESIPGAGRVIAKNPAIAKTFQSYFAKQLASTVGKNAVTKFVSGAGAEGLTEMAQTAWEKVTEGYLEANPEAMAAATDPDVLIPAGAVGALLGGATNLGGSGKPSARGPSTTTSTPQPQTPGQAAGQSTPTSDNPYSDLTHETVKAGPQDPRPEGNPFSDIPGGLGKPNTVAEDVASGGLAKLPDSKISEMLVAGTRQVEQAEANGDTAKAEQMRGLLSKLSLEQHRRTQQTSDQGSDKPPESDNPYSDLSHVADSGTQDPKPAGNPFSDVPGGLGGDNEVEIAPGISSRRIAEATVKDRKAAEAFIRAPSRSNLRKLIGEDSKTDADDRKALADSVRKQLSPMFGRRGADPATDHRQGDDVRLQQTEVIDSPLNAQSPVARLTERDDTNRKSHTMNKRLGRRLEETGDIVPDQPDTRDIIPGQPDTQEIDYEVPEGATRELGRLAPPEPPAKKVAFKQAEKPGMTPEEFEDASLPVPEGMDFRAAARQPGGQWAIGVSHGKKIMEDPQAKEILAKIPTGSKYVGHGQRAIVFRTPDGEIVRVSDSPRDRSSLPEVEQPIESTKVGKWTIERMRQGTPDAGESPSRELFVKNVKEKYPDKAFDLIPENTGKFDGERKIMDGTGIFDKADLGIGDAPKSPKAETPAPDPVVKLPEGEDTQVDLTAKAMELPDTKPAERRSKAKLTHHDYSREEIDSIAKSLGVKTDDIPSLVGAPDDAIVNVGDMGGADLIVDITGPEYAAPGKVPEPSYKADRTIGRDEDGKLVIVNSNFKVHPGLRAKGIGAKVLAKQVQQAAAAGVDRIDTFAAKGGDMNGYIVWAKLGFDGPIPGELMNELVETYDKDTDKWVQTTKELKTPNGEKTIQELMKTAEGQHWWEEHGNGFEGTFDLKPGSVSRKALERSMATKEFRDLFKRVIGKKKPDEQLFRINATDPKEVLADEDTREAIKMPPKPLTMEERSAKVTKIFESLAPDLKRNAMARGAQEADAADAVQNTMIDLIEGNALDKFDPSKGSMEQFVRGIATNEINAIFKESKRAKTGVEGAVVEQGKKVMGQRVNPKKDKFTEKLEASSSKAGVNPDDVRAWLGEMMSEVGESGWTRDDLLPRAIEQVVESYKQNKQPLSPNTGTIFAEPPAPRPVGTKSMSDVDRSRLKTLEEAIGRPLPSDPKSQRAMLDSIDKMVADEGGGKDDKEVIKSFVQKFLGDEGGAVPVDFVINLIRSGYQGTKKGLETAFHPSGALAADADFIRQAKYRRDASIQGMVTEFEHAGRDLAAAMKDHPSIAPEVIDDALHDHSLIAKLPAGLQAPVRKARQLFDDLTNRMIATGAIQGPMLATLKANRGFYMHQQFKTFTTPGWADKIPTADWNRAIAGMRGDPQFKGLTDQQIKNLAYNLLKEGDAEVSGRGNRESHLGILKGRKVLPPWLKDLFGLERDPLVNAAETARRMAHLIGEMEMWNEIGVEGKKAGIFVDNRFDNDSGAEPVGGGSVAQKGVEGLFTKTEVKEAMDKFFNPQGLMNSKNKTVRWIGTGLAVSSGAKTVGSVATQFNNFVSSGTGFAGKHWMSVGQKHFKEALADAGRVMKLKGIGTWHSKPTASEKARLEALHVEVANAGLLGDTASDHMLVKASRAKEMSKWKNHPWVKGTYNVLVGIPLDFYAAGDQYWKVADYLVEKAELMKAGKSEAEAKEMAADRANRHNQSYKRQGVVQRTIAELPFMGGIGAFYQFDQPRMLVQRLTDIAKDLQDPKLRKRAIGHFAGMLAVNTAIPIAMVMGARLYTGITAEEEEEARKHMADWDKNATMFSTGRDKDGNIVMFNIGRMTQLGGLMKALTAAYRGGGSEAAMEWVSPIVNPKLTTEAGFDIIRNRTAAGRQVFNPEDSAGNIALDAVGRVAQAFTPGVVDAGTRVVKSFTDPTGETGRKYNTGDEIAGFFGARPTTVDVRKSLEFKAKAYTARMQNAAKLLSDPAKKGKDLATAHANMERARQAIFDDLWREIGAARVVMGNSSRPLNDPEIADILKSGGMGKQDSRDVVKGVHKVKAPDFSGATPKQQAELAKLASAAAKEKGGDVYEAFKSAEEKRLITHLGALSAPRPATTPPKRKIGEKVADYQIRREKHAESLAQWSERREAAREYVGGRGLSTAEVTARYKAKLKTAFKRKETQAEHLARMRKSLAGS